jgi:hypothetical protein
LTVTNGAYTAADVVGGVITLGGATESHGECCSVINSVKLAGVVAIPYHLWFMSADVIAGTVADNGAFAIAAADEANYLGHVVIAAADYTAAQSAFNVATVKAIGLQVSSINGLRGTIYAYLVADAATSPGTATIVLTVDVEFLN